MKTSTPATATLFLIAATLADGVQLGYLPGPANTLGAGAGGIVGGAGYTIGGSVVDTVPYPDGWVHGTGLENGMYEKDLNGPHVDTKADKVNTWVPHFVDKGKDFMGETDSPSAMAWERGLDYNVGVAQEDSAETDRMSALDLGQTEAQRLRREQTGLLSDRSTLEKVRRQQLKREEGLTGGSGVRERIQPMSELTTPRDIARRLRGAEALDPRNYAHTERRLAAHTGASEANLAVHSSVLHRVPHAHGNMHQTYYTESVSAMPHADEIVSDNGHNTLPVFHMARLPRERRTVENSINVHLPDNNRLEAPAPIDNRLPSRPAPKKLDASANSAAGAFLATASRVVSKRVNHECTACRTAVRHVDQPERVESWCRARHAAPADYARMCKAPIERVAEKYRTWMSKIPALASKAVRAEQTSTFVGSIDDVCKQACKK